MVFAIHFVVQLLRPNVNDSGWGTYPALSGSKAVFVLREYLWI